jgi:phosphatidylglycerophosphate synthase
MADVESQERVHDMLLGPLERPALRWLAARIPRWVSPDLMTAVGVAGAATVALGYWLTHLHKGFLWLASLGFVINWFGDSLDGTLARHRKIERPRYGFFVDHMADALSMVLTIVGIGLSPYVRLDIAALAGIGYTLLSVITYVGAFVSGEFRISYGKFGPTEMRLLGVLANAVIFFVGNPTFELLQRSLTLYDMVALMGAGAMLGMFIVTATRQALHWNKLDRPVDDPGEH